MSRLRYTASCCILIYISSCNLKKTHLFIWLIIFYLLNYASVIGLQQVHSKEHEVHLTTICSDGLWLFMIWNTQYPLYPLLVLGECSMYEHMPSQQLDCTFQLVFTLCYFTEMKHCNVFYCFFQLLWYISPNISEGHRSWKKCISWNSSCMQKNTIVNLHNSCVSDTECQQYKANIFSKD